MSQRLWAVVPAAGQGSRFGGEIPKQYQSLAGRPMLWHSLQTLIASRLFDKVIVTLAADDRHFSELPDIGQHPGVHTVEGGDSRAQSVQNALSYLSQFDPVDNDFVLVHDAARPLLHREDLRHLVTQLADDPVGGVLASPLADTIKRELDKPVSAEGSDLPVVQATVSREGLWAAQTPQFFRYILLAAALEQGLKAENREITDESMAMELAGYPCRLVEAKHSNFKITRPADRDLAEQLLMSRDAATKEGVEA